jgi:hypothetical protein
MRTIFWLMVVVGVLWLGWNLIPDSSSDPPASTEQEVQQPVVEALVLMKECLTPCSALLDYRFKIRTDGHPLRIKFPGVDEWFEHPAEGDARAPSGITDEGETLFVSPDVDHPHVQVQVYKKTTAIEVQ